jgi:hypothetical protein
MVYPWTKAIGLPVPQSRMNGFIPFATTQQYFLPEQLERVSSNGVKLCSSNLTFNGI